MRMSTVETSTSVIGDVGSADLEDQFNNTISAEIKTEASSNAMEANAKIEPIDDIIVEEFEE